VSIAPRRRAREREKGAVGNELGLQQSSVLINQHRAGHNGAAAGKESDSRLAK